MLRPRYNWNNATINHLVIPTKQTLKWLNGINSSAFDCRHNIYACNPFTFKFYAVGILSDFKVWHAGFSFLVFSSFNFHFCHFLLRSWTVLIRAQWLRNHYSSHNSCACQICFWVLLTGIKFCTFGLLFKEREGTSHQSSFFSVHEKKSSAVRKNAFTLEYDKQQNEMNRHEASMRQQQANVFFPLSKH